MAKILAIFNIAAAAASIAGLLLAIQLEGRNWLIALAFASALILCLYVLFVPANKIEKNIAAKLRYFKNLGTGKTSAVQRGEFSISDGGPTRIEFHQPFSAPPSVEVMHISGKSGVLPTVSNVSVLGAEFRFHSYSAGFSKTFLWVALGEPLEPAHGQSE